MWKLRMEISGGSEHPKGSVGGVLNLELWFFFNDHAFASSTSCVVPSFDVRYFLVVTSYLNNNHV